MAKPGALVTLVAEISYLYCLHLKENREVIVILRSLLKDIAKPAQERLAILPGSTSLTLFEQCFGFFYVLQEPYQ